MKRASLHLHRSLPCQATPLSKRHRLTISDYAVVALCPSLIVLLLSSLVYFVILCVYQGGYSSRLGYIWFMFILGTVNIARLSIEQSRAYATGYAAVLGIATFFVLSRFQTLSGNAAALAPVVNFLVLAGVWFLADRITYDCTLIDDDDDASGQGLLDGLSSRDGETADPPKTQPTEAQPTDAADTAEVTGTAEGTDKPRRQKKKHQPGRTVLWLTAAALPIFGAGQAFLRSDPALQRSALFALAIYLFATLSLLVATSFLGVRRYLRQRGVEMPSNVSTAWLGGGIVTTAIILMLCFALPQPGQMLANLELPTSLESPDWLKPSKYGWGSETAESGDPAESGGAPASKPEGDSERDSAGKSGGQNDNQQAQPGQGEGKSGQPGSNNGEQQGEAKGGDQKDGKQQGGQQQGDEQQGGQQQGDKQQGGQQQGDKQAGQKSDDNQSSNNQKNGDQSGDSKQGGDQTQADDQGESKSDSQQSEDRQSGGEKSQDSQADPSDQGDTSKQESDSQKSDQSEQNDSSQDAAQPSEPSQFSQWLPSLTNIVKAIIYLILLAIVAAFIWINRAAIADFWKRITDWLSGRRSESDTSTSVAEPLINPAAPPRPFASFTNPLSQGVEPRRAVIETFQATEAWYREHGHPRRGDETPQEYSNRLTKTGAADRATLNRLTDAYNRIVYGGGSANQDDLQSVKAMWQSFRNSKS